MKIFLQARVNSKRFPKKVLKEIYKKKNSLEIIIDKISKIGYKNDLVVLPDVLCAHRKFINTTENNTSDSGFKENLITKLYYRIKLIFIAILRSFK